jgi:hypothetical protein
VNSPHEVLDRLRRIRSLRFEAQSEAGTGWNGVGVGSVVVSEPSDDVVLFSETGTWPSEVRVNAGETPVASIFPVVTLPARQNKASQERSRLAFWPFRSTNQHSGHLRDRLALMLPGRRRRARSDSDWSFVSAISPEDRAHSRGCAR